MATKRDCIRATKFIIESRVCCYPFKSDCHPGPIVRGKIIKIISSPDINNKYDGEFEVDWTGIGVTHGEELLKNAKKIIPNPVPGSYLRLEKR